MNKIITHTGKEFETEMVTSTTMLSPECLFVQMLNISLRDATLVFSDPNETIELIHVLEDGTQETFTGFVNLISAHIIAMANAVEITLQKDKQ